MESNYKPFYAISQMVQKESLRAFCAMLPTRTFPWGDKTDGRLRFTYGGLGISKPQELLSRSKCGSARTASVSRRDDPFPLRWTSAG